MKYARNGDVRLAYGEMGDGEVPIVLVPGWVSNVDLFDDPTTLYAGISEQIARHARMIVWDKRGTGLSDPVSHVPPIDERMDDLRAVLDAADVEYPAFVGVSEGDRSRSPPASTISKTIGAKAHWRTCSSAPRSPRYPAFVRCGVRSSGHRPAP